MNKNQFKILVATDIHLGYLERDEIRGNDSINTFEEILQIAHYEEVDFLLLGGDLFHENKPSRKIMCECIQLLRKYCIGISRKSFKIYSSASMQEQKLGDFNISDPHMNVSIPVFSIHGNHDDPIGADGLCSLDVLSKAGLVNYFGKMNLGDELTIEPVILEKGHTKICLCGIGATKDYYLHSMLKQKKVSFDLRSINTNDTMNIMVLHQNRIKHNSENYIPEKYLFDFIDLVIWGHEHECLIEPEHSIEKNYYICQPGSSIITSLSKAESKPKHVGILLIDKKEFKITKIRLNSVRPLLFKSIDLHFQTEQTIQSLELASLIETQIENLLKKHVPCPHNNILPLLRLRIRHKQPLPDFNARHFVNRYTSRVANHKSILHFKQLSGTSKDEVEELFKEAYHQEKIEDYLSEYMGKDSSKKFRLISMKLMSNSLEEFIYKDEKNSITNAIDNYVSKILQNINLNSEEAIDDCIKQTAHNFQKNELHESTLLMSSELEKENITLNRPKRVKR